MNSDAGGEGIKSSVLRRDWRGEKKLAGGRAGHTRIITLHKNSIFIIKG